MRENGLEGLPRPFAQTLPVVGIRAPEKKGAGQKRCVAQSERHLHRSERPVYQSARRIHRSERLVDASARCVYLLDGSVPLQYEALRGKDEVFRGKDAVFRGKDAVFRGMDVVFRLDG